MEGEIIDFQVHIRAILEFRKTRQNWRILSSQTRQLNEMSGFLSLLAYTTFPHHLKSSHVKTHQRHNSLSRKQNFCLEFTYGVTADIAHSIEEIFDLHKELAYYIKGQETVPEDILEACEALGNRLISWSLDNKKAATVFPNDANMQAVFTHHANAWHNATLIYYMQCIQGSTNYDVTEQVARVLEHMNAGEDIKLRLSGIQMAPITWPAFIASCSAENRDPWVLWWN